MRLSEAFKALDALNEDTFSLSDDGIKKLAEFENNDDLVDELSVIDLDAETEEDLQDSYVGKIILDCTVCHSKLYKDLEEIELNEEQTLANVGEECPYCYTSDGFKVLGQVSAFGGKAEDADTSDSKDSDDTVEENLSEGIFDKLKKGSKSKKGWQSVSASNIKAGDVIAAGVYDTGVGVKDVEVKTGSIHDTILITLDDGKSTVKKYKDTDTIDRLQEAVATLERPLSNIGGTLSNVMSAHSDELATVSDSASAIAFLDSIEPEVKNKNYLNSIKDKLGRMPGNRATQFLYNIILKGDGMGTKMEDLDEGIFGKKKSKYYSKEEIAKRRQQQDDEFNKQQAEEKRKERERGERVAQSWRDREERQKQAKSNYERDRYNSLKADKSTNTGHKGVSYSGGDYYSESIDEGIFDRFKKVCYGDIKDTHNRTSVKAKDLKKGDLAYETSLNSKFPDDFPLSYITKIKLNKDGTLDIHYNSTTNVGVDPEENYVVFTPKTNNNESLNEDINNISVDTDDSHMELSQDDTGKVTVTTEPISSTPSAEGEVVTPLTDENEEALLNGDENSEETSDDSEGDETSEVDLEIEDFDEESFDDLGEQYFREAYTNVETFRTLNVTETNEGLLVEGVIRFASGNDKKTSFIFESHTIDKDNKVKFIGENKELNTGKGAFTVTGKINESKLIVESLHYNYESKNKDGNVNRISGLVKRG